MRSWFGDDEAERRRRRDEMYDREWDNSRRGYPDWRFAPATGAHESPWFDRDREYYSGGENYRPDRYNGPAFDRGWGPYYGKGPRGYRRSDERIREDVCDRLTDAPDVDASEVEIQVSNAEVVLRGTVNSRTEKRRAEDIAEQVSGVNDVRNEIRVTGERTGASDFDLTGSRKPTAIGETPEPRSR